MFLKLILLIRLFLSTYHSIWSSSQSIWLLPCQPWIEDTSCKNEATSGQCNSHCKLPGKGPQSWESDLSRSELFLGHILLGYSGMRIHGIGGNCVLLGPILIPEQNWWSSGLFGIDGIGSNRVLLGPILIPFRAHFEDLYQNTERLYSWDRHGHTVTDQCLVYLLQCLSKVSVSYGKWTQKGAWQTNKQVKLVNMASGRSDSCKTPCTSWECSQSGGQNKRNFLKQKWYFSWHSVLNSKYHWMPREKL